MSHTALYFVSINRYYRIIPYNQAILIDRMLSGPDQLYFFSNDIIPYSGLLLRSPNFCDTAEMASSRNFCDY